MRFVLASVLLAIATLPSVAQQVLHASPDYSEQIFPRAKVSGGLVVGAQFDTAKTPQDWSMIEVPVRGVPKGEGQLCARVTKGDGTYESVNTYLLPKALTEKGLLLDNPSKHPDKLEQGDAMVRVSAGSCNDDEAEIIPAGRSSDAVSGDDEIAFYVNAGGAETVASVQVGTEFQTVLCDQVTSADAIKFTSICWIKAALLDASEGATVYLDVTRNGQVEPFEFKVRLGGS